jgi:tetratricopeptide (TPR) repeat protein
MQYQILFCDVDEIYGYGRFVLDSALEPGYFGVYGICFVMLFSLMKRKENEMRGHFSWFVRLTVIVAGACVFGCSPKLLIKSTKKTTDVAAAALEKYDDPILLGKALPGLLITSEGYLGAAPDDVDLLVSTAGKYSLYASFFVEEVDKEHAIKLYRRGLALGMRALMQNRKFAKGVGDGSLERFESAIKRLNKSHIPALYVTMSNWFSFIALNSSDSEALMGIPKVEAIMNKLMELDETYNNGIIHAYFGAYYGSFSKVLGGQPEKAKYHFERAFEISGSEFLYFYVLYAQTYAVQIQDKELFVTTLEKVLDTPKKADHEMTMANEIAKMKAKTLLSKIDEYFL